MHYNIIVKEYLQQYNGSCVSDTFWVRTLAEKRSGATDLPNRCTGPCNAEPFPLCTDADRFVPLTVDHLLHGFQRCHSYAGKHLLKYGG